MSQILVSLSITIHCIQSSANFLNISSEKILNITCSYLRTSLKDLFT